MSKPGDFGMGGSGMARGRTCAMSVTATDTGRTCADIVKKGALMRIWKTTGTPIYVGDADGITTTLSK